MDAHVTTEMPNPDSPLIGLVHRALQRAMAMDGKLPAEVLAIPGMSGRKYRLFINNLIGSLPDARYLEVGVWAGSTLCAAIHGNAVQALAIDNWSQFEGPFTDFFRNVSRFKGPLARVSFIEADFRKVAFAAHGRFGVYLFDGPHQEADQRDGVALALPALDDTFVLIVDDWNWAGVRTGTLSALELQGLRTDYATEIRTTLDDSHAEVGGPASDWHNGYFIAVLSKPKPAGG